MFRKQKDQVPEVTTPTPDDILSAELNAAPEIDHASRRASRILGALAVIDAGVTLVAMSTQTGRMIYDGSRQFSDVILASTGFGASLLAGGAAVAMHPDAHPAPPDHSHPAPLE